MKKFILILTVLSFFFSKVSATELTLQDCIAMALKNNRGLKACEMDILYSDQDKKISRTRFFPSFGVKGEYTLRDKI